MTYGIGVPNVSSRILTIEEINHVEEAALGAALRVPIGLEELHELCETARQALEDKRLAVVERNEAETILADARRVAARSREAEAQWKAAAFKRESEATQMGVELDQVKAELTTFTEETCLKIRRLEVQLTEEAEDLRTACARIHNLERDLGQARRDVETVKAERDSAYAQLNERLHNENALAQEGTMAFIREWDASDPKRIALQLSSFPVMQRGGVTATYSTATNVKLTIANDQCLAGLASAVLSRDINKLQKEKLDLLQQNADLRGQLVQIRDVARAFAEGLADPDDDDDDDDYTDGDGGDDW